MGNHTRMMDSRGVAARLLATGCVLIGTAGCGPAHSTTPQLSLRSGAPSSLQPGIPHCAAAIGAAAREHQNQQSNQTPVTRTPDTIVMPSPLPTTGSPPPNPSPTATAVPLVVTGATLKLGPAELSRIPAAQYVVRVGTLVDVELPDEQAPFCWSIPTLSVPSVLRVEDAGDDLGGGAHARFRAVFPGTVTVQTISACYTYPSCGAGSAITAAVLTVRH